MIPPTATATTSSTRRAACPLVLSPSRMSPRLLLLSSLLSVLSKSVTSLSPPLLSDPERNERRPSKTQQGTRNEGGKNGTSKTLPSGAKRTRQGTMMATERHSDGLRNVNFFLPRSETCTCNVLWAVSVYTQQSTASAAVFPKHFGNMCYAEQITELGV